ncbi:G-type lectin S-receptor-like serine/threonine-protein kinase At4g03230 [Cornus florida]|uniref:G-type lectin S-receptor-like serine/threonine-protein kinase At4g03230 n=1 Tax=Cornus florida TaxID=4283 RepID=UPI0028A04FE3|nr:G-type lectin S-receptor-like serine/threonine-protein kinase At4g03230 [Cornus florida]
MACKSHAFICHVFFLVHIFGQHCAAISDNITKGSSLISEDESLISAGQRFQLGFFNLTDDQRYLGVRYYNFSNPPTIVWVANRDTPLPASVTGYFGVGEHGNLVLMDEKGNTSYFYTDPQSSQPYSGTMVKLLDSGNLVLSDAQSGNTIWQSFDHPTNTFLPGMKMDENLKLTSWRSGDDPGTGNFTFEKDKGGDYLYNIQKRSITYWKNGESGAFISYNDMSASVVRFLSNFTTNTSRSINYTFGSISGYDNRRLVMDDSGQIQLFKWDNKMKKWSLIWSEPRDQCSVYNYCGNFGSCNSKNRLVCKCLPGFKPNFPDNWNSGDFSGGCTRKSTTCTGSDAFLNLTKIKVKNPDYKYPNANSEEECKDECLHNCQCLAYSYVVPLNLVRGSSSEKACWMWTTTNGELGNLQEEYAAAANALCLRVKASDIGLTTRNCDTCGTNFIPYPLSTGPNCGDSTYFSFLCNSLTGHLSFRTPRNIFQVTSINPDTNKFVIQSKSSEKCEARGSGEELQLNASLPFNITADWCYTDPGSRNSHIPMKGWNEIEIAWKPPQEPTCNSSKDCKDWPNSSCNITENGNARCLCIANYHWNGSSLNCTQGVSNNTKQPGESEHKDVSVSLKSVIIFVIVIVIVVVVLLCSISYIIYRRIFVAKREESRQRIQGNPVLHSFDSEKRVKDLISSREFEEEDKQGIDVPFFDLESILTATENFSEANKLGQGGFGPVYKGKFHGGKEIAVKRLSSHSGQGLQEFKNEVVLIAKLQHRNLVRLLGYCIKGDEKILLYEYMPNKSLDAFIFDPTICMLLDWEKRFDIILGVARGLLYLHQDSRLRIIHRDLKTSNILLDEEMNPKISDFGLARIMGSKEIEANTNKIIGSYGYMSPEYALDGLFSVKSDVFSYGVVLLEIISGKKNTGFYQSEQASNLLGYAWRLWREDKTLDLMDQTLVESCNRSEVLKCIIVGLLCVQEDPGDRPTMSNVLFMLGSEIATLPNPKQPAFVARRKFTTTPSSSSSKPETLTNNELTATLEEGR